MYAALHRVTATIETVDLSPLHFEAHVSSPASMSRRMTALLHWGPSPVLFASPFYQAGARNQRANATKITRWSIRCRKYARSEGLGFLAITQPETSLVRTASHAAYNANLWAARRSGRVSPRMTTGSSPVLSTRRAELVCSRYVVFSDLHVDANRLETCLQVLERVHELATARDAGIIFLGDFWHLRGSIPVICLNRVLETVQQFTVPCLMLPGNHDQVSICGREHALVPVAAAMQPGLALVFDEPVVMFDALWLPYRKRPLQLVEALREHGPHVKAVFCHAEIQGAWLNNQMRYGGPGGIAPELFPPSPVPTYAGHFHRPHTVTGYPHIQYVGSPYQVTRAEEGQEKHLLVVRSTDWLTEEIVPLAIGPRFFRVSLKQARQQLSASIPASAAEATTSATTGFRPGDRVTLLCTASELQQQRTAGAKDMDHDLEYVYNELRRRGIHASMRLWDAPAENEKVSSSSAQRTFVEPQLRMPNAERLDAADVLRLFARQRPQQLDGTTLALGLSILEQIQKSNAKIARGESFSRLRAVHVVFDSVRLHNFGCFHTEPDSNQVDQLSMDVAGSTRHQMSVTSASEESHQDLESNGGVVKRGRVAAATATADGAWRTIPAKPGIWYPLRNRGIVQVSGRNLDEDGCNSNGTGKTTLAMAALWALTGSLEPRPHLRRNVSQLRILHEDATEGFVELRASVNGKPLLVRRKVRRSGKQRERYNQELFVEYDSRDLTRLSIEETQQRLNEIIDLSLLPHVVFFGQNYLHGLLSTTDKEFKEILESALPLQVWNEAYAHVTARQRALREERQQLAQKIQSCSQALERERERIEELARTERETRLQLDLQEQELKQSLEQWQQGAAEASASDTIDSGSDNTSLEALRERIRHLKASIDADVTTLAELQRKEAKLHAELAQAQRLWDQWAALHAQLQGDAGITVCQGSLEQRRTALHEQVKDLKRALQELQLQEQSTLASIRHLDRMLHSEQPPVASSAADCDGAAKPQQTHSKTFCALCLQPVDAASYADRLQALQTDRQRLASALDDLRAQRHDKDAEIQIMERELRDAEAAFMERHALEQRLDAVVALRPTPEHLHELSQASDRCSMEAALVMRTLDTNRQLLAEYEQHLLQQQELRLHQEQQRARYDRALRALDWTQQQRQRLLQPIAAAILEATAHVASLLSTLNEAVAHERTLVDTADRLEFLARAFHRGGIPSQLLDQSLQVIETLCGHYLRHLSDDTLLLRIRRRRQAQRPRERELTKATTRAENALEVLVWQVYCRDARTGTFRERELGLLSGGQLRRVSIALSLAFAEYICHQLGYRSNLLVLDEALQQLDQEGARRLASLLPQLQRETVLVIAHENASFLVDIADAHDVVERASGRSTVHCDTGFLETELAGDSFSGRSELVPQAQVRR